MSDEVKPKRRKKMGWGGARPNSGPKPSGIKRATVTIYLRDYENDALHFLAVDRGKSISRVMADLIMEAYGDRVNQIIKS